MTLDEAIEFVREGAKTADGVSCPCCGQLAKVYRRRLNSTMAAGLIWLARSTLRGEGWTSPTRSAPRYLATSGGEIAKLAHWGLIEERPNDKPERKRTSGYWRTTIAGLRFANGKTTEPTHVYLYDGNVRGFSEKRATIYEALGSRFSYQDLWTK